MVGLLLPLAVAVSASADPFPPRELLLQSLVAGVGPVLKSFHPDTGRFGTEPWICTDQNVLFPLAVAWATQDPANKWYHDEHLLQAIAAGGNALVDDQDAKGMWTFRKKDKSTWGQIHMPWTYSRWIRAYALVRDALPPTDRAKWDKGLRLGFTGIRHYMDGRLHNIPAHHAMGLYVAGQCYDQADWRDAAAKYLRKIAAAQDPGGFWTEHFGPVIGYNEVYVDALGVYYAVSHDEAVLPALRRSAQFHSAVLWPDGTDVACIDERQIYHRSRDVGNVGFTWTPEGRGYLRQQLAPFVTDHKLLSFDYAAALWQYGGQGEAVAPASTGARGRTVLGQKNAVVERRQPWQWCFSAYACTPGDNRWIQDRHNLVDVFADGLGLLLGGGNTKLQPYWSTFTVGDPALLSHRAGDENPNFAPPIDLRWYPTAGRLELPADGVPTLRLQYGDVAVSVTASPRDDGRLALTYRLDQPTSLRVEAHVPLLRRRGPVTLAGGRSLVLAEADTLVSAADLSGGFTWDKLQVELPAGASLRWPARQHNPYAKDGKSSLDDAKLVVVLPLTTAAPEQTVVLGRPAAGQAP